MIDLQVLYTVSECILNRLNSTQSRCFCYNIIQFDFCYFLIILLRSSSISPYNLRSLSSEAFNRSPNALFSRSFNDTRFFNDQFSFQTILFLLTNPSTLDPSCEEVPVNSFLSYDTNFSLSFCYRLRVSFNPAASTLQLLAYSFSACTCYLFFILSLVSSALPLSMILCSPSCSFSKVSRCVLFKLSRYSICFYF